VLLMWAGILAYLDRYGYDYVTGCVSVPIGADSDGDVPGSGLRGVRDFILGRHAAPPQHRVHPYRPVRVNGRAIDDIPAPPRPTVPPLLRGYLRLGAQVCGEPAHDPDFGVGDFCVLLDKRRADTRYLRRLRSVSAASEMAAEMAGGAR
jgi:putative hemolysin